MAMRRRALIAAIVGAAAWPVVARGQQAGKVFRIGFMGLQSAASLPERTEAFRAGLRDLGYQDGRDIVVEYRWADGRLDQLPAIASELARLNVNVIVTHGIPGILAAKRATTTIPIVMAVSGDAVASGLVSSIARPGGNVTGLTFFTPELAVKRLELLKESMPGLKGVGVLLNPSNPINEPIVPAIEVAAKLLKMEVAQFAVRDPAEFESSFGAMAARNVGALVILEDNMLIAHAQALANLTLEQRLPSNGFSEFAVAGGLMAYGVSFPDMFRRAAAYVDKILKGVRPGDLPIEQPTKFETILNLKTAKAIGFDVPTALLLRADQVIE
jgi:putative tryptophan/tyrosine transport system substrate-binding protein